MGYYIFGHRGSGDHGKEDQLRGICSLLPRKPEVYSGCPEEDWRYGIGALGGVYRSIPGKGPALSREDWVLELEPPGHGGGRRICWGAPQGPLNASQLRRLSRYEAVVVTEDRSHRRLTGLGLKNVTRAPEPSFLVERRIRPLEGAFRCETVGLCLTLPEEAGGLLYRSYQYLIRYIIRRTSLQIALIPYCVKTGRNDLLLLSSLAAPYLDTGRIHLRKDGDSQLLRGDLSLCSCCGGGEGVVAAWGCGVRGRCLCATDGTMGFSQELLGSWQAGVCPWECLSCEETLTRHFQSFLIHTDRYRNRLTAR